MIVGVIGGAIGVVAGLGIRLLLRRLPRGMTIPVGPAEFLTAGLTAVGAVTAWGTPRIGVVGLAGFLAVALGLVDVAHHRLPDAITLPAISLAAVVIALTTAAAPHFGSPLTAVVAAVLLCSIFAAVSWISPRSMGRGDVKLMPSLGLLTGYLGVPVALTAVVLAFGFGALVAVAGLAGHRLRLTSAIPFGPFLLIGAWVSVTFPAVPALLGR